MEERILYLYLERVSRGDKSYLKRLCRQISDKTVFVPIEDSSEEEGSIQRIIVKPCQSKSAFRRKAIPVFTNQELYFEWAKAHDHTKGSISLLCGDLCIALGKQGTLQIDPGKSYSVKITPEDFSKEAEDEIRSIEEELDSFTCTSEA